MAPATTTSSPSPAPTAVASDYTDFINTIGTAVGPILTLFGEQATKQFISMSMGWADNILLAMGPIGIITVIVSTIRIGGSRSSKAIIGRSRESRASAEQELLSSTSEEVCELWSGRGIVRVTDKINNTKDLIIFKSHELDPGTRIIRTSPEYFRVLDIAEAITQQILIVEPSPASGMDHDMVEEIALGASSITLNVRDTIIKSEELWFWTLIGVLLQLFTLAFPAITTYYWKWLRRGIAVPRYAYGCFLAGTATIIIGLLGCGYVIEGSTTKYLFRPSTTSMKSIQRIIRIQIDCTVGSQHFPSFVILNHPENMLIRASHLSSKNYYYSSAAASLITIAGFIVQFLGLSALHWSAVIIVLGLSLLMTGIRAWVRRGFARVPLYAPIPAKIELVWLALRTARNDWDDILRSAAHSNPSIISLDCEWGILTGFLEPRLKNNTSICDPALLQDAKSDEFRHCLMDATKYVRKLNHLSGEKFVLGFGTLSTSEQCPEVTAFTDLISNTPNIPLGDYADLASKLAAAIEGIMDILELSRDIYWKRTPSRHRVSYPWRRSPYWRIDVQKSLGKQASWIVDCDSSRGRASLTSNLNAGLSLWMYSIICGTDALSRICDKKQLGVSDLLWIEDFVSYGQRSVPRIIGDSKSSTVTEMESWFEQKKFKLITSYNGKWELDVDGRYERGWQTRPVFGIYYSASFEMQACPDSQTEKAFIFRPAEDKSEAQDIITTGLDVSRAIETECALEILSFFMLSICMNLESIHGKTERSDEKMINAYEKSGGKMKNSVFTALAQQVVDAGLVLTIDDALLYIIPAFAKFHLLPRRVHRGESLKDAPYVLED